MLHTYTYNVTTTAATLTRYLVKDWEKFEAGLDPSLWTITDELVDALGAADLESALRMAANEGCAEALDKNLIYDIWFGVFSRGGSEVIITKESITGTPGKYFQIQLDAGTVGEAGTDKMARPYNLVNNATKLWYIKAKGYAWNWLVSQGVSGAKGHKRSKATSSKNKSGTLRGQESLDNSKIVKAHGKAQAWGATAEIHSAGKYQTTVAMVGLTKMIDEAKKVSLRNEKWGDDINNSVATVEQEFRNALDWAYDLQQYRDVGTGKFDEEIIMKLHATDAKGNSEFATRTKYDMPGVKREMDKIGKKIAEKLGAKLRISKNTKRWTQMEGSKPRGAIMDSMVKKMLIEKLLKTTGTRPDFRLKVNKKLLAEAMKDTKVKRTKKGIKLQKKTTKGPKKKTAAVAGGRATYRRKGKSEQLAKTGPSPITLRNLLNAQLPELVASKMTQPALQYRTGRFANSARVENVSIGPRGGTHIDYTYMRNPYETFEPGGKQGSTQRDPRKIIGASIRELAMGLLGRQPTSIRRN